MQKRGAISRQDGPGPGLRSRSKRQTKTDLTEQTEQTEQTDLTARSAPSSLSNIWLLRARPFDGDVRGKEATELRAYLVPGRRYVIGSNGKACDIVVKEDKTVSRTHATLTVVPDGLEGEKPVEGHVEVTDISSHARTYLTKDMKDILKGERIRDLGHPARAYHSYFLMLGRMSPFRLTRMNMQVCVGSSVSTVDLDTVVRILGMTPVDLLETKKMHSGSVRMVVGKEEEELSDELLLAVATGVPVVTVAWAKAWLRPEPWVGSGPGEDAYDVCVFGRGGKGGSKKASVFSRRDVADALAGTLGKYRLGWFQDVGLPHLVAAAEALGLRVGVIDEVEEWVAECEERPLAVLTRDAEVWRLPQMACDYCLVDDLRYALFEGNTEGLIQHVDGDLVGSEGDLVDSEGWHSVGRQAGRLSSAGDAVFEAERGEDATCTIEAQVLSRERGRTSKIFKKKHRVGPRQIINVVGHKPTRREEDKEWVEVERERQAMNAAFDRQGLVTHANKPSTRRVKK